MHSDTSHTAFLKRLHRSRKNMLDHHYETGSLRHTDSQGTQAHKAHNTYTHRLTEAHIGTG